MASIIMHMAVAMNIKNADLDLDRFLFGTILPDYVYEDNAHYKEVYGDRKFFNLAFFRELYGENLNKNPVYLGYYLHLVQDMIFRDFMYNDHGWSPKIPGNIAGLYDDYSKLNGYLIDKFSLTTDILKNPNVVPTAEYPDFTLNKEELEKDTEKYLVGCGTGEYFFFTPKMADEFIEKATAACFYELDALKGKGEHLNEKEYSWKRFF